MDLLIGQFDTSPGELIDDATCGCDHDRSFTFEEDVGVGNCIAIH